MIEDPDLRMECPARLPFNNQKSAINNDSASVEIRAAQIEPALGALQLATALAQFRRAVRTVLPRISLFRSRPMSLLARCLRRL